MLSWRFEGRCIDLGHGLYMMTMMTMMMMMMMMMTMMMMMLMMMMMMMTMTMMKMMMMMMTMRMMKKKMMMMMMKMMLEVVVAVLNYRTLLFAQEQLLGELTFEMNKPHLATRFRHARCLGWKVMELRSYRGEIL